MRAQTCHKRNLKLTGLRQRNNVNIAHATNARKRAKRCFQIICRQVACVQNIGLLGQAFNRQTHLGSAGENKRLNFAACAANNHRSKHHLRGAETAEELRRDRIATLPSHSAAIDNLPHRTSARDADLDLCPRSAKAFTIGIDGSENCRLDICGARIQYNARSHIVRRTIMQVQCYAICRSAARQMNQMRAARCSITCNALCNTHTEPCTARACHHIRLLRTAKRTDELYTKRGVCQRRAAFMCDRNIADTVVCDQCVFNALRLLRHAKSSAPFLHLCNCHLNRIARRERGDQININTRKITRKGDQILRTVRSDADISRANTRH